jgi:putative MATE family efflux protein
MDAIKEQNNYFGTEKISKILLKMAPPVMLAQLIQALYNIVDSVFVGRFSDSGLTALSIIYPIQLLMIALAVGTGVGINTVIAAKMGLDQKEKAKAYAGVGTPLAVILWVLFALITYAIMPFFARMSTSDPQIISDVIVYGRIVCVFSFGLFLESIWTKILQAKGDMKTPMIAQILGAITNIILDPLFIFGLFGIPKMGIAGAAIATVAGQMVAALVVMRKGFHKSPALRKYPHYIAKIFRLGLPNILMQSAYTFYIFGLNLILATFSDAAVTVLGLYYKWQTFFFIPLGAMQTCIVPVISFNYAAKKIDRCKKTLHFSILFGMALMFLGTLCFHIIPEPMLRFFSSDEEVIRIGITAFRIIGWSFLPLVTSLTYPVLFQAVGSSLKSSALTILRTVVLFVPLGYLFSLIGLDWFWMTYPVTDGLTSIVGFALSASFFKKAYTQVSLESAREKHPVAIQPSRPGPIITIAREHGSGGKQIGKMIAEKLNIPFYYKEMTALAAEESGLSRAFISGLNKNSPRKLHDLYLSRKVVGHAIRAQYSVIQKIAENGSCVIVGRAADYVLHDDPNVFRVFVRAPEEYRAKRVMEIYGDSENEAKRNIRHSDKARASYYKHISGHAWGGSEHYDLIVDSSEGLDLAANEILNALSNRK